ncbi:MAG: BREX-1 system phosphatase PglZ type A, partial [Lachnospiraceae bacterium]|nr:BREX-1 system phosphatase PglZ type A [Lachnospiraceae bacterium]
FEGLRTLIENIYTNEYLGKIMPKWNEGIQETGALQEMPLQRNFYNRYLRNAKERTVVIISDAMRYEVGQELFKRMLDDPKCTAKMEAQLSVLPSYTRLGMAALLPHKSMTMTDDFRVLVDDVLCNDLSGRQTVLQKHQANGVCVQFDDIKGLKKNDLRDIFTGMQVVYVYHNQIDARGDKPTTEDEVFVACQEAIAEIMDLIRKISTNANTYRFIITSDHGFIYKRDKLSESDKIGAINDKKAFINRRFIVAQEAVVDEGVQSLSMGLILDNDDTKQVSFPVSSNVFKVAGGGQNFVHGGSSPQEMLVPVLDIKMERGHMETRPAQIALVSIVQKITNLITTMDFIQTDAVSDTVKKTTYKMYFVSEDNEKISNENIYIADSRDADPQKRIFRMRFTFKNKKYDKNKQYYLVVYDDATGIEAFRHPVIMDLAFSDDFGFNF